MITSAFTYGDVPDAPGVDVVEAFYRGRGARTTVRARSPSTGPTCCATGARRRRRRALPVAAGAAGRRAAAAPPAPAAADRARRAPAGAASPASSRRSGALYERMDAVVVHSEHGAARLRDELGLDPALVHVIRHGTLTGLDVPGEAPFAVPDRPVVLMFGLLRPYKGVDVLLDAWERAAVDAELWIVGMPRMDVTARARAQRAHGAAVRLGRRARGRVPGGVARRAPYREIDQSGVLFTALAFGKPMLLTSRRRLPGGGGHRRGGVVAAGRPGRAGRGAATRCSAIRRGWRGWRAASRAAAEGEYGWDDDRPPDPRLYSALRRRRRGRAASAARRGAPAGARPCPRTPPARATPCARPRCPRGRAARCA